MAYEGDQQQHLAEAIWRSLSEFGGFFSSAFFDVSIFLQSRSSLVYFMFCFSGFPSIFPGWHD
ncbi:hypothetical protein GQ607_010313 [Colletotrichum asianum]|uniref:Uncharacterized protein n=1 Tax=Colletotrichum asianum TaxID=702518 RepID=A0A8H3ZSX9_9PEZI|nr:hypothetical protein GQ607_010313 [Colletotrichum asianum]